MPSRPIDLNNLDHLNKNKLIIKNNPVGVDGLVDRFPFHQLQEISELNFEVISLIGDVITLFINHAKPIEKIHDVMKYYHRIIRFQIDTKENNFDLLKKCLCEFQLCFKWANSFKKKYICNELNKLLHEIVTYPGVTNEIIEIAIDIFINLLKGLDVEQCNETFKICALSIFDSAPNNLIKLRLSCELLRSTDSKTFPDISKVYVYLIKYVGTLKMIDNIESISYIIKCIMNIYKTCEDDTVLHELSINLAINNFPETISGHYNHQLSIKNMKRMFYWKIDNIFKQTPWICPTGNLSDIIINLSSTYTIVNESHEEFKFILYYLKLVYNGVEHDDRMSLINEIKQRYENKIPDHNPALLKAIYLLCSAYSNMHAEHPECYNILLSLQANSKIEDYVTYHVSQLIWVLTFGSRQLKLKVLTLFIKNYKHENYILQCLLRTDNQWCLMDVLKFNDDKDLRIKTLQLLKKCTTSESRLLILLRFFTRPHLSFEIINVFKESKVAIPIYMFKEDRIGQEIKSCALFVIRRFMKCLYNSENNISADLNFWIIENLHRLCWFVRNDEEAINAFAVPELVKRLLIFTQSEHSDLVPAAISFSSMILQTQLRQRLLVTEEIELQIFNMRRDDRIIGKTIRLLKCIIGVNRSHNANIKLPYLGLYHNLLDVLLSKHGCEIVTLLNYLMKKEKECVLSVVNALFIKMHCRQCVVHDMFIRYLVIWCEFAFKEECCIIPGRHISLYVDYLKSVSYPNVNYLKKLEQMYIPKK